MNFCGFSSETKGKDVLQNKLNHLFPLQQRIDNDNNLLIYQLHKSQTE